MQHRDASKDCVGAGLGALALNQAHPRPNPLHLAEFLVGLFGCFYFTLSNDLLFNVSFLLLCSEAKLPALFTCHVSLLRSFAFSYFFNYLCALPFLLYIYTTALVHFPFFF